MKKQLFGIMLFLCLIAATAAQAATRGKDEPVHIEANRMEADQKKNSVHFTGKVEARQGSLVIHADEMTVYYGAGGAKSGAATSQTVSRMVARGNVMVNREGWLASGDTLEFSEAENKVELSGNTRVWQDNNLVTGETIVLYLDEGKSVIGGAKKQERVKAFFYPEQKGGEQAEKSAQPPAAEKR